MSAILVVGSLAYDSIETPSGKVDRTLGGSANYFSLAASEYSEVRVVGVVGQDYSEEDRLLLKSKGVNIEGMKKVEGKTFHWEGSYEKDLNEAITKRTDLNVFEHFNPQLPESYKDSKFVFLANIAPELQMQVLNQTSAPLFVGMDTMNYWISSKKSALFEILKKVDVVLINEGEAMMLTGASNAIAAAPKIIEMGPQHLVIKRGEYGFVLYSKDNGYFILPAFPIPNVVDPTGAGDTFAGGFFGYLASLGRKPQIEDLKKACVKGGLWASFTIEDFGVQALKKVKRDHVLSRWNEYQNIISYKV